MEASNSYMREGKVRRGGPVQAAAAAQYRSCGGKDRRGGPFLATTACLLAFVPCHEPNFQDCQQGQTQCGEPEHPPALDIGPDWRGYCRCRGEKKRGSSHGALQFSPPFLPLFLDRWVRVRFICTTSFVTHRLFLGGKKLSECSRGCLFSRPFSILK